jgi:putative zinc finger protein
MSECTNGELRDLLPELVNDRLDAESRQRVEAHVASCADCADELALLRSLRPALTREPVVDTQRIAAAVLARTAGAASHAPARAGIAVRWRVAIAAAALLAAGALGYVATAHHENGAPEIAVAPAPGTGAQNTGKPPHSAPESAHAPATASSGPPPVHAPQRDVAIAPPHVTTPPAATSLASTGVLENVSDLSDDEVRALTASLDHLSAVPEADPSPGIDPLGASFDDASAGGR